MSLINDALKKAQKQREGSAGTMPPIGTLPPAPPGPTAPLSPTTPAPGGKNQVALIIAGAAVIVSLSVAATVYFLRKDNAGGTPPAHPAIASAPPKTAPSPSATPASAVVATPPAPASSTPAATPAPVSVAAPETTGSAPTVTPSPAPVPVATPPIASTGSQPTPSAAATPAPPGDQTGPAVAQTPSPAPAASAPAPIPAPTPAVDPGIKSTYRVQGLVDKFRISGIRLADTDSKVLLNDHLFRVNDLVEPSLGLKLTSIESHVLTFTDAGGNTYLKHF